MPFQQIPPSPPLEPQTDSADPSPLLRLGGLFPTQSGKALTGNVNLSYVGRDQDATIGERLIQILEKCIQENRPLRFVIFENQGKFGNKVPYILNVTIGRSPGEYTTTGESLSPEAPPPPPPPQTTPRTEPTPRPPIRRIAPRRP